jgi:hypothetical protein
MTKTSDSPRLIRQKAANLQQSLTVNGFNGSMANNKV